MVIETDIFKAGSHARLLADYVPCGIFETDAQGQCTFVNQRWSELTGLSLAEAFGNRWGQAIHPDDRDLVFSRWAQCIREGVEFALQYRFQKPDGQTVWVFTRAQLYKDAAGVVSGCIGCVNDVTYQKRTEDERDIFFELSVDLLCVVDSEGLVQRINPAFTKVLGVREETILGSHLLDLVHPDDRARTEREFNANLNGRYSVDFENRYRTSSGLYVNLEWRARRDPSTGNIYGIARDVTARAAKTNCAARSRLSPKSAAGSSIFARVMYSGPKRPTGFTTQAPRSFRPRWKMRFSSTHPPAASWWSRH